MFTALPQSEHLPQVATTWTPAPLRGLKKYQPWRKLSFLAFYCGTGSVITVDQDNPPLSHPTPAPYRMNNLDLEIRSPEAGLEGAPSWLRTLAAESWPVVPFPPHSMWHLTKGKLIVGNGVAKLLTANGWLQMWSKIDSGRQLQDDSDRVTRGEEDSSPSLKFSKAVERHHSKWFGDGVSENCSSCCLIAQETNCLI